MIKIRTTKEFYKSIYDFCQDNMGDDRVTVLHIGGEKSDAYEITTYPKSTRRAYSYSDGSLLVNCLVWENKVWGLSEKDNKKERFETNLQSFKKIIKQNNESETFIYRPQTECDVVSLFSLALPQCIKNVKFEIILVK